MDLSTDTKEIGPNLFASVMGTGIIANAAVTLPGIGESFFDFGAGIWILATLWLVILTAVKLLQIIVRPYVIQRQLTDPVMSQFFGAPPMAFLTISGGFALIGIKLMPSQLAMDIGWWLWVLGTVMGIVVATVIPYLQFTQHEVREDGAFGGWLMPVVPPMVSAAIGALYIPYLADAESRELMLYFCYSCFGISFFSAFIIITLIWRRLSHYGTSGGGRVPTLWIVLGPLGQSVTAMGALGVAAYQVLPVERAALLDGMSTAAGIPIWGFAMYWAIIATFLTVKAIRLKMPFSLTWWAFTFPVGTCVTGTTQLALHTQLNFFEQAAAVLFFLLLVAWIVAAVGTIKGMYKGHLLKPATGAPPVVSHKKHKKN